MFITPNRMRSRLFRDGEPGEPNNGGGGGATPPDLGDAGKAAIDREREAAREANRLKAAAEARANQLQKELEALQTANQTDQEKAITAARNEAKAEAAAELSTYLVSAAIETAAAAAKFVDPGDAAALLAGRFGEVPITGGTVDKAKAAELVKELAESKPHLVQSGTPATQPLPGQGTPTTAPKTGSVSAGAEEYRRRHQTT